MIVAADGLDIHQIDAALLAGIDHQFFAVEVEDRGRDLHVEIALVEPLGVGGAVIVD